MASAHLSSYEYGILVARERSGKVEQGENGEQYSSFSNICAILAFITRYTLSITVEPRFNEVAGDRSNLFVKSRARYIENLDITNLSGNDQNVRYIEVIVND